MKHDDYDDVDDDDRDDDADAADCHDHDADHDDADDSVPTKLRSGVVRLELLPNAAYFEGRCRGVVRLRSCRRLHILEDGVEGSSFLGLLPRKTESSASSV